MLLKYHSLAATSENPEAYCLEGSKFDKVGAPSAKSADTSEMQIRRLTNKNLFPVFMLNTTNLSVFQLAAAYSNVFYPFAAAKAEQAPNAFYDFIDPEYEKHNERSPFEV